MSTKATAKKDVRFQEVGHSHDRRRRLTTHPGVDSDDPDFSPRHPRPLARPGAAVRAARGELRLLVPLVAALPRRVRPQHRRRAQGRVEGTGGRGRPPGILAYPADEPIAWVSLGPREDFSSLERSRVLKRVDELPVWSIVCFFVGKRYRRQGLMVRLLQGAVDYAAENGAQIVEGYPVDPAANGSMAARRVSWGWRPPTAKQDSSKSPGRTSGGPSCDITSGVQRNDHRTGNPGYRRVGSRLRAADAELSSSNPRRRGRS